MPVLWALDQQQDWGCDTNRGVSNLSSVGKKGPLAVLRTIWSTKKQNLKKSSSLGGLQHKKIHSNEQAPMNLEDNSGDNTETYIL